MIDEKEKIEEISEESAEIILEINKMLTGKSLYMVFKILAFVLSNLILENSNNGQHLFKFLGLFIKDIETCINNLYKGIKIRFDIH